MNKCKVKKECRKLQMKINGKFICHKVCTHNEWVK